MFLSKLYATIEANNAAMHARFDTIDRSFDAIDHRLDAVDGRLDGHESRFDRIERLLDAVIDSLAGLRRDFREHTHGPDGRVN